MELRNGIIIALVFTGGCLIGLGIDEVPSSVTLGLTIWISVGVYGYLTRTRRLR